MGDGCFRNIAILRKLVNFSASLNSANFPVIKRALAKVVSVPGRLLSSCKYTSTCPKVFLKMSRGHFLKHKKWKNKFYLNSGKHERLIGIYKIYHIYAYFLIYYRCCWNLPHDAKNRYNICIGWNGISIGHIWHVYCWLTCMAMLTLWSLDIKMMLATHQQIFFWTLYPWSICFSSMVGIL